MINVRAIIFRPSIVKERRQKKKSFTERLRFKYEQQTSAHRYLIHRCNHPIYSNYIVLSMGKVHGVLENCVWMTLLLRLIRSYVKSAFFARPVKKGVEIKFSIGVEENAF